MSLSRQKQKSKLEIPHTLYVRHMIILYQLMSNIEQWRQNDF